MLKKALTSKCTLPVFFLASLCVTQTLLAQSWSLTTLAGSRTGGGYLDGSVTEARFSAPHAIAVGASGNIFVADRGNHVIRKVTPSGDVSTFAGLGGVSGSADGSGS